MATRKSKTSKRQGATRKAPGRKAAQRKTAKAKARKRTAAKPASSRARRVPPKRPRKAAPRKAADPRAALAAMARRIIEVTVNPSDPMAHLALYAPGATSTEATMDVARGLEELVAKSQGWEQMQEGVEWIARSVCLDPANGTICIEWDASVKLRGGPTVPMREVAIHEVKNGQIVAERYYYNPNSLAPAQT
jgi:hypothetical protein